MTGFHDVGARVCFALIVLSPATLVCKPQPAAFCASYITQQVPSTLTHAGIVLAVFITTFLTSFAMQFRVSR